MPLPCQQLSRLRKSAAVRVPTAESASNGIQESGLLRVQALADFQARIAKYEEVYQTLTDRNLHYIKLIDMCAPPALCMCRLCIQGC